MLVPIQRRRSPTSRRWAARVGPFTASIVGAALLAGGCGGGSPSSSVAHIGSSTASAASPAPASPASPSASSGKLVKYSQCMRSHGVPAFPDPVNGGLKLRVGPGSALNPNSPQFKSAEQACKALQPTGPPPGSAPSNQLGAQALKFAQCVRSHGVPNFPDPRIDQTGVTMNVTPDIANSPQFKSAQQACRSLLPGGTP